MHAATCQLARAIDKIYQSKRRDRERARETRAVGLEFNVTIGIMINSQIIGNRARVILQNKTKNETRKTKQIYFARVNVI